MKGKTLMLKIYRSFRKLRSGLSVNQSTLNSLIHVFVDLTTVVVMLDLSVEFDNDDHKILLERQTARSDFLV